MIKSFFKKYFELLFWAAGLIALAITDPAAQSHFSLCPLKQASITWCPGCGIGHAIAWLFKGNIQNSFHAHWFGIPALLIILWRVFTLSKKAIAPIRFNNNH